MKQLLVKDNISRLICIFCMIIVLMYPNLAFALTNNSGITYVLSSFLFIIPVLILVSIIPIQWIYCVIVGLLTVLTIGEQIMVDIYKEYLLPGSILSTIKTNPQEASEFFHTNFGEIFHLLPILILGVMSCIFYRKPHFRKYKWLTLASLLLIPVGFITYKLTVFYRSEITLRYYVNTHILNRPPYNVFYQSWNTHIELEHRRMAENMKNINMGAHRNNNPVQKEIFIFAIGESLRYDNVSLNGKYKRTTTPRLEAMKNIMIFDDYYSQACLTMYSVPQLVTRATPDNYDINYAERSVIEPFRECGFKVFTIVSNTNLLSYETYLSNGADSLIIVPNVANGREISSGDKTMIDIVDSLANKYDKLFIMMQFMGNHSFFTNYEQEYEQYNPNSNNCPANQVRDSMMLINAYDNSILYTDYILSSIIEKIDRPKTVSGFMFVSDHGEVIGNGGAGHGGNCKPVKSEYHVPFIFWWSDEYVALYPKKIENAKKNKLAKINGDCMYYILIDMAGISLDKKYDNHKWSVLSDDFEEHPRYILVPDGKTYFLVK